MTDKKIPLNIYAESTPNPAIMKFVSNILLVPDGRSYELNPDDDLSAFPLAARLFTFPFITKVYMTGNFLSLSKADGIDWQDVFHELRDFMYNYIITGHPIIDSENLPQEVMSFEELPDEVVTHSEPSSDIESRIIEILDEYVKPAVESDGGNILFRSFDNGRLTLSLRGACNGCPSSTITLKNGIQNIFEKMLPEVKEVVAGG